MRGRRPARLLALVTAAVVVAGCGVDRSALRGVDDDGTTALSDAAVVEYHFGDASLPPEHHRSYTLTITRDEVHAVVDSYGDVLHDVREPLPAGVWETLATTVGDVATVEPDVSDEGCAGGTSRSIDIRDGGEVVVDETFGVCGGTNSAAAERLDAWAQPVLDAIPGWDGYVEPGS